MSALKNAIKRAFAVEPDGPAQPNEEQQAVVDRVCKRIVRHRLTTPGLAFLGLTHPLNFYAAQLGGRLLLGPWVWMLASKETWDQYNHLVSFVERRGSIEYICRRVEQFEAEHMRREDEARDESDGRDRHDDGDSPKAA